MDQITSIDPLTDRWEDVPVIPPSDDSKFDILGGLEALTEALLVNRAMDDLDEWLVPFLSWLLLDERERRSRAALLLESSDDVAVDNLLLLFFHAARTAPEYIHMIPHNSAPSNAM